MENIENLQPDYDQAYNDSTEDAIKFIDDYLNADEFRTIDFLVTEARQSLKKQLDLIVTKKGKENWNRTDPFTGQLVSTYDEKIKSYKNNVSALIHRELPTIRSNNTESLHEYKNHEMTPKEIAGLLAKYHALRSVLNKLNVIKATENDSPEDYIRKLRDENTVALGQSSATNNSEPANEMSEPKENPYPRIFKNLLCYHFFRSLQQDVRSRYPLADYSFIYRRMQKDKYIYEAIADGEFRSFLEELGIVIDKTKLLEYSTTDLKEKNYNTKKALLKPI